MSNLKKLQMLLTTGTNKTAQTSTCVMVLLLSFALLVIPNVNPFGANSSEDAKLTSKETHFAGMLYSADLFCLQGYFIYLIFQAKGAH